MRESPAARQREMMLSSVNSCRRRSPRLSFLSVALAFRQIIGSLTALSVLLCSLLCACPASANAVGKTASDSHQAAGDKHEQRSKGHCHGSGSDQSDETDDHSEKPAPAAPCDHGQGGSSCTHCDSQAVVRADTAAAAELVPHQAFALHFLPVLDLSSVRELRVQKTVALDGSPPAARWSTLLQLHCALII